MSGSVLDFCRRSELRWFYYLNLGEQNHLAHCLKMASAPFLLHHLDTVATDWADYRGRRIECGDHWSAVFK